MEERVGRVFENWMLRIIFWPKPEEVTNTNFTVSYIIVFNTKDELGDQIEKYELGWTCCTHGTTGNGRTTLETCI
jgi:hypothetical protein